MLSENTCVDGPAGRMSEHNITCCSHTATFQKTFYVSGATVSSIPLSSIFFFHQALQTT